MTEDQLQHFSKKTLIGITSQDTQLLAIFIGAWDENLQNREIVLSSFRVPFRVQWLDGKYPGDTDCQQVP